jgi:S-formylglutathione hydrolase FrmB
MYANTLRSSASTAYRWRRLGVPAPLALIALSVWLLTSPAARAQAPQFQSADGITVVSQSQTGREIDLTVSTTAVQGQHKIIVLLPEGYDANPSTRYPTLYLLNGALADPTQWVANGGAAAQITDPYSAIVVMEDGGVKGWYYNWKSCANVCPENWETFHNQQVVPWIDANLRTIASRAGRGIAGLSMGGWGAIHYAESYSQLYSYAAAFSGALDTGNFTTDVAIGAEEAGIVPGSGTPVPVGSIFGWEFWPVNQNLVNISDVNPANIANLKNTTVNLYVGTGNSNSGDGIVESAVYPQNQLMAYNLSQAGINYWYSQDHTSSPALGWGCDNNHDIMCWNAYLNDAMPRFAAAMGQSSPPASDTSPPLAAPPGNVVADGDFMQSGNGPWNCIGSCGVDHNLGNGYASPNNGWVRNVNGWQDIDQTVTVRPNTNYTLTGWLRTSPNNNAGYFGVRDTSGNVISEVEYNNLPGYTQLTVSFNSGNRTSVVVYGGLWPPNFQDTWMQIDDVSLIPTEG